MNRATIYSGAQVEAEAPSANSATPIKGTVKAVHVSAALSSLSDQITVTVKTLDPEKKILDAVTIESDGGWFNPRELINLTNGTEIADAYNDGIAIHDFVNISFTGGEDGDEITVDLYLE